MKGIPPRVVGGGWSYGNEEVLGGERGKSKKRDFWEIPDSLSPHRSVLTVLELLDLETCRNKIFVAESTVEKKSLVLRFTFCVLGMERKKGLGRMKRVPVACSCSPTDGG